MSSVSASAVSVLAVHELNTELVESPVVYRVLRPGPIGPHAHEATIALPLLLLLHGGGGSCEFLATMQPLFERLWADGTLPPLVVATPSAGRSFYVDRFDKSVQWEQFLFEEFIPHLVETTGAGGNGASVALSGVSMGGLGALRLAFRKPAHFVAVAVVEPAIEQAVEWSEVLLRDRVYRDDALMQELFGNPVNAAHFRNSHPRAIAEDNGHSIVASGLDRGYRQTEAIDGPAGPIEVHVYGQGPTIVLLPSLGRSAADFTLLAARLARSGYLVLCPEPRGIGESGGLIDGLTMNDLADDVAAVLRTRNNGRATVIGHAFGNRVARVTATRHSDLVDSVVLLACGGRIPPSAEDRAAMLAVFDTSLSDDDHLRAVRQAFFAPGNDPTVCSGGWHPDVARVQTAATAATDVDTWWTAGNADVLVVQPADDVIAVPANGLDIVEALDGRARMITIPNAGHALLPEQPKAVATAILTWLGQRSRTVASLRTKTGRAGTISATDDDFDLHRFSF